MGLVTINFLRLISISKGLGSFFLSLKQQCETHHDFHYFTGSHHVPSVQSRLRTISNLTRKLSLSNSRIIENPSNLASRLSSASSSSRINNNGGIGKPFSSLFLPLFTMMCFDKKLSNIRVRLVLV